MKISVIVPAREKIPEELLDCLRKQQFIRPYEIIEVVGEALTVQRNEGVKAAEGDIILFLDDDIRDLSPFHLWECARTFRLHPDAVGVTGPVTAPAYRQNLLYHLWAHLFLLTNRGRGKFKMSGFPQNYSSTIRTTTAAEMVYGCNMAWRQWIFQQYKFCEDMDSRMYGEDDWFAWQVTRRHPVYYNPRMYCSDLRPYPRGKQAHKIRCTFVNLIKRAFSRKPTFIGWCAFWWAFAGFIGFKIGEALVMRDGSIIKGMGLCFRPYHEKSLEEIRKGIRVRRYVV